MNFLQLLVSMALLILLAFAVAGLEYFSNKQGKGKGGKPLGNWLSLKG